MALVSSYNAENESSKVGSVIEKSQVTKSNNSKPFRMQLHVNASKRFGILVNAHLKSVRVNILHISSKGDTLVNDGKNIMMVPSDCVTIVEDNEKLEGKKRLQFIRRIYDAVCRGDLIDTASIYLEIQKWML